MPTFYVSACGATIFVSPLRALQQVPPSGNENKYFYLPCRRAQSSERDSLRVHLSAEEKRNSDAPTKEHQQLNCVHAAHRWHENLIRAHKLYWSARKYILWSRARLSVSFSVHMPSRVSGRCCSIKISRFQCGPLVIIIISPPPSAVFLQWTRDVSKSVVQGVSACIIFIHKADLMYSVQT